MSTLEISGSSESSEFTKIRGIMEELKTEVETDALERNF
jgi:hypothetical protein